MPAQQWLLESAGIEPADPSTPSPGAPRSQNARWTANLAAARQFHAREGHLHVPRQHVETTPGSNGDGDQVVKLGAWLDNTRRRAAKLSADRRSALDALAMRSWSAAPSAAVARPNSLPPGNSLRALG
ncbi:helicase associated domain-containing protein [Streptomyces arenae]|uniref:helicase associated domain-containing protein n=1 Tax=Streptomyces arenae TaxID=29301 RepID=UPI0026594C72|nr:helicase associated domain-containing protein [Streptomyces arenae]MCG7204437.1 helicase associated domain-containing protein [Streptomyces arenae]